MTKNSFINTLSATLYIAAVAMIPFFGKELFGDGKSFLIPIAMLSLFTLSAAVMGYMCSSINHFFYSSMGIRKMR